jgi:hypothetical protein
VVAPGANPGVITLSVQGTQGMTLDGQGNLVLHTGGGDVEEQAPVLYQESAGGQQAVTGRFVLEGKNQVGFQVGAYDPSRPLVIDPVLSYSTYLGGSAFDKASSAATSRHLGPKNTTPRAARKRQSSVEAEIEAGSWVSTQALALPAATAAPDLPPPLGPLTPDRVLDRVFASFDDGLLPN